MLDFYYLANILANINNMLKPNLYHLNIILTNTNDKANNFIKKKSIAPNQLLTLYH